MFVKNPVFNIKNIALPTPEILSFPAYVIHTLHLTEGPRMKTNSRSSTKKFQVKFHPKHGSVFTLLAFCLFPEYNHEREIKQIAFS